ncbi:MAG: type II secretion system secretin GspD [Deltaproteobacteria bacterium]
MSIRSFFLIGVVMVLLAISAGLCLAKNKPAEEGLTVDFKEIELPDLIHTISELTGKNFVFDEKVRGKATIISPRRMSINEAYQVFLSVLRVKGYAVVPEGPVNKIVSTMNAKEFDLPGVAAYGKRTPGEQYVTRLVPLKNINAGEIATSVLAPLVPKTTKIVAYDPTNTLIISDTAANIEGLVQILKKLDVPDNDENLEVIQLEYANAEEVAKVMTQLLSQKRATAPRRRGRRVATADGDQDKVIPFRPTNMLVVMAGDQEIKMIKDIAARLDQKPSQDRSGLQVYYLENADAETLAGTLNEILTGMKKVEGTKGAAAKPGMPPPQPGSFQTVTITADKPTNSLIINSTPEDYDRVRDIIRKLDIKRKQVYVEALILELSMDDTLKIGSSLQGVIKDGDDSVVFGRTDLDSNSLQSAAFQNPSSLLTTTINGILLGGIFNPVTVIGPDGNPITVPALSALIDLSKQDNGIDILSAPRLLTSDNEEAEIVVGQNVPIITSRLTNAVGTATSAESTGLATSVAVERKDVALDLKFVPQITEGDLVRLNISQEITDLAPSNVGNVDQVGPTFTTRKLHNTVVAKNGRTVVLGGLISSTVQDVVTKVPLLGDIPVLGWLFKRKKTGEVKRNLLIFITPHIIKNASDLAQVTSKARQEMSDFKGTDMREPANRKSWTQKEIQTDPAPPVPAVAN